MVEVLDVGPRRNFRHHAAIGRMVRNLRKHDIADDFPASIGIRRTTAAAVSSQDVSMPRIYEEAAAMGQG